MRALKHRRSSNKIAAQVQMECGDITTVNDWIDSVMANEQPYSGEVYILLRYV